MKGDQVPGDIEWLNSLPPDRAEAELLTCCASRRWAREIAARRPYADLQSLTDSAVAAVRELSWPDVEEALSAHPRIGDRAKGEGRESRWSRGEQSGTASADQVILDELADGNVAYENRFGHVFLIRATGRSASEMLSEQRKRLTNPAEKERTVVRGELAEITRLRVRKLLGGVGEET